jgi:hypothetical protein
VRVLSAPHAVRGGSMGGRRATARTSLVRRVAVASDSCRQRLPPDRCMSRTP